MNQFTSLIWTDQIVVRLKELRESFLSAGEMAKELGITRNQIIGKLRRLGLSAMSQKANSGGGRKKNRDRDVVLSPLRFRDGRGMLTAPKKSPLPRQHSEPVAKVAAPPGGVSIWDHREGQCRWPNDGSVSRPGSPENTFRFCGAPGDPYCDEHAKRSRGSGTPSEKRTGRPFGVFEVRGRL